MLKSLINFEIDSLRGGCFYEEIKISRVGIWE